MPAPPDILILEPDSRAAEAIACGMPLDVTHATCPTIAEAEGLLDSSSVRLLLCSDDLPGETGLMFLARTRERWPALHRVLMAADLDGDLFFHAMREVRIFSYLAKPVDRSELVRTIHHALQEPCNPESVEAPPEPPPPPHRHLWLTGLGIAAAGVVSFVLLLALLWGLYEIKCRAGIDLFPAWHLRDIVAP